MAWNCEEMIKVDQKRIWVMNLHKQLLATKDSITLYQHLNEQQAELVVG